MSLGFGFMLSCHLYDYMRIPSPLIKRKTFHCVVLLFHEVHSVHLLVVNKFFPVALQHTRTRGRCARGGFVEKFDLWWAAMARHCI